MNGRIEKVSQHGNFSVYRRLQIEPGTRRYGVYQEPGGYWMQDFRMLKSAMSFAKWKRAEQIAKGEATL
jgi:hypothetical protein